MDFRGHPGLFDASCTVERAASPGRLAVRSSNGRDLAERIFYPALPMNREALDDICERSILGLALCILVFGPLAMGAVDTPAFLVIQGLTLLVMLLWGARFWLNARPQLLWPPICWAVTAFTLYAIVRYLTSDIEYVARQE